MFVTNVNAPSMNSFKIHVYFEHMGSLVILDLSSPWAGIGTMCFTVLLKSILVILKDYLKA